jgi:NAD(P)-dependent dehydrogenase (short-subunit alcohol dehydrogenase family)
VLVTGASRGIGRSVANRLARDGADVVLVARDRAALDAVRRELAPGDHACCALDVCDEQAWVDARSTIAPEGRLSGVVAAAGQLGPVGPVGSWSVGEFRSTIEVNVVGTLLTVSTNLDYLRGGAGSVVFFSGGGATTPFVRYDAYAASKAAVVRLAENLAAELATADIRVNSVAPGFVVTDIHHATLAAGPDKVGPDYFERTRRAVESGEGDSPELAASLVSFLVSPGSSGITGKLLSARWDPWEDPEFRSRLRSEPHLATLRRIDDQFFCAVAPSESDRGSPAPSAGRTGAPSSRQGS